MGADRITVRIGCESWDVEHFVFPGGELQVSIPGLPDGDTDHLVVTARLASAEGLVKLMMATEIIARMHRGRASCVLPYLPYGQQDRVMGDREAFSLKVMAWVVNATGYGRVVLCDPHSDVGPAVIDRSHVIHQHEIVARHPEMIRALRRDDSIIVSPDAGAAKKAAKTAAQFGRELICGTKVRDATNGQLSRIELPEAHRAAGKRAIIIDDICVGGATFFGLARTLKEVGARQVLLYVTHGVFSKGLSPFLGLIDWVLTTDTFPSDVEGTSDLPLYRFSVDELIRSHLK